MRNRSKLIIFFILALNLLSCNKNRHHIDVSDIHIQISVARFEKDLFAVISDSIEKYASVLYPKYNEFYIRFVENIINIGSVNDPMLGYRLQHFANDPDIKQIYNDCNKSFSDEDIQQIVNELTQAFKHYAHYFPEKSIPTFLTFISGFNYSVITTEKYLGIGLDMYLGKDYTIYQKMGYPMYKINNMQKEYIVADALKAWLGTEFMFKDTIPEQSAVSKDNMLNQIIYYGKIMYLLDAMLPDVDDTIKIDYSNAQLQWCKENEFNIWSRFVDQKLFFSTSNKEIIKYTNDGPFSSGFPKESPARIGNWLGWQIVRSYMEHQPEKTLNDLIYARDANVILTQSRYKPR